MTHTTTNLDKNQGWHNSAKPNSPYLSDSQIANRYGVSRQTTWRWAATDPTFPKPIKLSAGCTRFKLSELEEWESAKGVA